MRRLLTRANSKIQNLSNYCAEDEPLLSLKTTENLGNLRAQLSAIDHCLNDINVIISGYLSYKASLLSPQVPRAAPVTDDLDELLSHSPSNLPSLEEAIKQYSDMLPNGPVHDKSS